MPITTKEVEENLFDYCCALASAARLFTLRQIARHPDISWRSQPMKRASEFLRPYRDSFEVLPGPHAEPFRWRLTNKERKRLGLTFKNINPMSQKAEHWLAFGDLWQEMTSRGGRPSIFLPEPKDSAGFDIFTVWQGRPMLIEIQLSKLTEKEWEKKWERRAEWYKERGFEKAPWQPEGRIIQPRPIVICKAEQMPQTVRAPGWATVVGSEEELCRKMWRKAEALGR